MLRHYSGVKLTEYYLNSILFSSNTRFIDLVTTNEGEEWKYEMGCEL